MNGQATHRILLIEDEPGDAFLIQYFIEQYDISIQTKWFQTGSEALDYLQDKADSSPLPTLILSDLNLPGSHSGLEVLTTVRQDHRLSGIPVVMVTGSGNPKHMAAAMELGAFDFFVKPTQLADIEQKIYALLRKMELVPNMGD